jgi:hypothetical protein
MYADTPRAAWSAVYWVTVLGAVFGYFCLLYVSERTRAMRPSPLLNPVLPSFSFLIDISTQLKYRQVVQDDAFGNVPRMLGKDGWGERRDDSGDR